MYLGDVVGVEFCDISNKVRTLPVESFFFLFLALNLIYTLAARPVLPLWWRLSFMPVLPFAPFAWLMSFCSPGAHCHYSAPVGGLS